MSGCDCDPLHHTSDEPVLLYRLVELHVRTRCIGARILEAERLERGLRSEAQSDAFGRVIVLGLHNTGREQHVFETLCQDVSVTLEEFHHTHDIWIEFIEQLRNPIEVPRSFDVHTYDAHHAPSLHPFITRPVPRTMICDIHVHLERFTSAELTDVFERAHAAGVTDIILNSLETTTFETATRITSSYAGPVRLHLAAGFYPLAGLEADVAAGFLEEAELDIQRNLSLLRERDGIVAIGEVGLDFTQTTEETRLRDEKLFEEVLVIARERDLPVIVHSRRAEERIIELLERHRDVKAVLHCFSGKKKLITRALERTRTWFSVPVIVEHSEQFQHLVEMVPESKLLSETDAPFLAPKGMDRSEPAHIARAIQTIARLKGLEPRDCELILYENARRLFRI